MGLASPASQTAACPPATNQQRLLFVARFPNGGYNFTGTNAAQYNNASMPNFVPAGEQGVTGGGRALVWDVVDGGGNVNSAGFVSSSSGQVIGHIIWDPILEAFGFRMTEARFANIGRPVAGSSNGSDAVQIKNFLTSINATDPNWPKQPQKDIVGDVNSADGSSDVS